ncbi:MAG: MarR family transcriptional regulator [Chloroflexi bacterium]|nr:MarR family transcriptional regulator [Chloroflexota bacterium]
MTASPTAPDLTAEIVEGLAPLLARHRRAWAVRCHQHGLSMVGFGVLALLEMSGPMPMSRIAEDLDVALPNATGIIGRLAERGIVQRTHDTTDRRIVLVGLTEAGRALIAEMEEERRRRVARLLGVMEPAQQQRVARAVKDLNQAAARLAAEDEAAT